MDEMVVDEGETTNGHDCDLNSGMGVPTDATDDDDDKGGLLFDSSSGGGGGNFGEGTSSGGIRTYTRKKRRKMSSSDEMAKSKFNDKIKVADGSASDLDVARLSFDPFPFGPREFSLRNCRKIVLQQMYQSLSGSEDGLLECIRNALVTHPESGCTSAFKESFDCVERSVNQTQNCAKELSHVTSSGSLDESESSTITELCRRAFVDILMSEKFSELCGLILKNFGDVNVNCILDVNAINSRMKSGAYEASPLLYLKDIQQVWTKLQQVGNELVTLAKSLSDKSRTHYEQFVRKTCDASSCQECGQKADVQNCLVCDSCEEIYHLSCTNLINQEIPPKNWYCTTCLSNGIGSPHDNCLVCEKLKTNSISIVNGVLTNDESEALQNDYGLNGENQDSKTCFICKSQVKNNDIFRTCGHSLCAHKFYHNNCLTSKQLGVCGPCWYCPSCLCRACLVDKDDDQIVLCDGCDQAYHIYCTSPTLDSIPKGSWFCAKCDRELKMIKKAKMVYGNMQKKVKIEENETENEENEAEKGGKNGGLDMLVTAAKTMEYGYP